MLSDEEIRQIQIDSVKGQTTASQIRNKFAREIERTVLMQLPEGCTPADAEKLREANHHLADEITALKAELDGLKAQEPVGFIKQDLEPFLYYKDSLSLKPDDALYSAPVPAQQSPRITEQDAREIVASYAAVPHSITIEDWLYEEGESLLAKLNGGNGDVEKVLNEWREAMQEFVNRCERGEVRSSYTYSKFKALLSSAPKQGINND